VPKVPSNRLSNNSMAKPCTNDHSAMARLVYLPDVPARVAIIATVLALVGAVKFTDWYSQRASAGADFAPAHTR
jgi:hypothetical protein